MSVQKILMIAGLSTVTLWAHATTYDQLVTEGSHINFQYQQMGVKLKGEFPSFQGQLKFDTEAPNEASIKLDVPLEDTDTGSRDGNEEVVKSEWLDVAAHPVATFTSNRIQETSPNHFTVQGELSIKGHSHEVEFPATFAEQDGLAVFEGEFSIKRGDYSIGEGAWAADDIVASEVTIQFHILADSQ